MIRYHINNRPRHRAGKWLLLGCVLCGSLLTGIHKDGFREVVAADNTERPANTLTREVFERIAEVQELRDEAEYEEALNILDEIRTMYDQGDLNNYEAYMMFIFYGSITMEQRQFEASIAYIQEALQIPDLSQQQQGILYSQLGYSLNQSGAYQSAIDNYMTYLEQAEEPSSNAYMSIAYAYHQMGRYEEAIPWAEQAIARDENMSGAYRLLLRAYLETGREEEAAEMSRTIEERAGGFAQDDIVPEPIRRSSNEYLPTETVLPRYPGEALREEVEGWVQVEFTANAEGEVIDPVVIDADPEGYFEESSLAAIRKFRFEPMQEDGHPVATEDVHYVFTYRLDQ